MISEPIQFLILPEWFRTIYVGSGMWQSLGWNSIIYLAALSGINPSLYEAAVVDGAGRWKQLTHITLPGILPTVLILLILNVGTLLNVGWDKIILLYNPGTYVTADVISTFVYRRGVMEADYSFSAAVGLFNSVINFTLLVLANRISRKTTESSLW
ncbi:putative multiple-sugar transport system permease YteP [compost metagenome]